MKKPNDHHLLDETFRISLLIKAGDGALEILGALFLALVPIDTITSLARTLTLHELSADPHDFIATHILHSAQLLTNGGKFFGALYLLSHGVIKVGLVWALLKEKLWAYPLSLAFLYLFILYQVYRVGVDHSISLTLLTVFDFFVAWLIWREWRLRKGIMHKKEKTA